MSNHLGLWTVDLENLIIQIYTLVLYLESQMNYQRNCMISFQRCQFEWIVIVADSSIQSLQHNH